MLQAARGRDVSGVTRRDEWVPGGQGSCTSKEKEGSGTVEGTQHLLRNVALC